MKRFILLLVPLLLLTSVFLLTPNRTFAYSCNSSVSGVSFNYDFTPPLSSDKTSINVTIGHDSTLPSGDYKLKVSDTRDSQIRGTTGVFYVGTITNNSALVFNGVTTTHKSFQNQGIVTLYRINSDQTTSELCIDNFDVVDANNPTPTTGATGNTVDLPKTPCQNLSGVSGYDANGKCNGVKSGLGIDIPTNPAGLVTEILTLILSLSGGIVIILIIRAGYKLMTSQGNPEKVQEAREELTSTIVGLLFIIFSFVILQFVMNDILGINTLPGFIGSK